jgi:LmbE family N-acetylglucosaminyl deacetylase
MKNILVVAVHPDDETLMCGGTILKHKNNGDNIFWLIITNVDIENGWNIEFVEKRQKEIKIVEKMYGFEKTYMLNYPAGKLDLIPKFDFISSVSKVINEVKPNTIYLPNKTDIHSDHKISFEIVFSCTKNFRYPFIKKILMGETVSETDFSPPISGNSFIPNVFVDITDFFKLKIDIFKIFDSEIMNENYPRSIRNIESIASYRGSLIGQKYAEAFVLLKEIL